MSDRQKPDRVQRTAPESMPPEPKGDDRDGSVAEAGSSKGAEASVTGDNGGGEWTEDTSSDRGSSAPRT